MLQFSFRALILGVAAIAVFVALAVSVGSHRLSDFLPAGTPDYLAICCLLTRLVYAATESDSNAAWCLLATAWTLCLFGFVYEFVTYWSSMSVFRGYEWADELQRRYPGYMIARLTIPTIATVPLIAILGNRSHQRPSPIVKWIVVSSAVTLIDTVVVWLVVGALMIVRIGSDGRPDWSSLFQ